MRVRNGFAVLSLCGVFAVAGGCDTAPGPGSGGARPPVVSDLTYTPQSIVLDQLPEDQVVDGRVRVPLSMSVAARDPDGTVDRVLFVVQSPVRGEAPLASGDLAPATGGRYEGSTTFEIPVGAVGTYTVLVYAVDADELISNQVRGALQFAAAGHPPVIERVEAPDRVVRPAPGEAPELVRIVAVVSDPDGLHNVSRVLFWNVERPEVSFPLLDDGDAQGSGDEVQGDGRYTILVRVESGNAPGVNTFAFQAHDRAGLASEVVEKQITIE